MIILEIDMKEKPTEEEMKGLTELLLLALFEKVREGGWAYVSQRR
jgi:hypothetical protein